MIKKNRTSAQGQTFEINFTFGRSTYPSTPISNWSGVMQIRDAPATTGNILYSSITTTDITITGNENLVSVSVVIPYAMTSLWTWTTGYYDLFIIDDNGVSYDVFYGTITNKLSTTLV